MLNIPPAQPRNSTHAGIVENQFPGFGLVILHQSFTQVSDKFAPGALMVSWWSWQITVMLWRWSFQVVRLREAVPDSHLNFNKALNARRK